MMFNLLDQWPYLPQNLDRADYPDKIENQEKSPTPKTNNSTPDSTPHSTPDSTTDSTTDSTPYCTPDSKLNITSDCFGLCPIPHLCCIKPE